PHAGALAGGPTPGAHDSGRQRPAMSERNADYRLGAFRSGSARPSHAGARGLRGGARQVRRRQVRGSFLPEAVALVRRAGRTQGVATQAGSLAAPEFPFALAATRVA